MARAHRKPDVQKVLLHHSDRGSQYASFDYRKALNELKATCSMSRKGDYWDNAVMERPKPEGAGVGSRKAFFRR
jgi:putative transposase